MDFLKVNRPSRLPNLFNKAKLTLWEATEIHMGDLVLLTAVCDMALFGTAIPYTSTFAVFSDYMKPAIRLAAIQKLHELYIFTHDSFYVGEDGPTHEPIEQLAMLRSIPDMTVFRPPP